MRRAQASERQRRKCERLEPFQVFEFRHAGAHAQNCAVLTATSSQAKFTPNTESLRNSNNNALAEDVFAIVAPHGKSIASFQMTVAPDAAYPGGSCLWGDSDNIGGVWLDWGMGKQGKPPQPELKPRNFEPIAAGTDVVYIYFPRAKKRPSIKELTVRVIKWADEKASPAAPVKPVCRLQSVGPLDSVPLEIPGIGSTGLADAALTKLADGRWLIAVPVPGPDGRRSIKLTMSRDLKSWEPLRDYQRHDMFDAIEPLLFQEGDDTWMFYRSNRFELNSVSTAEVRLGAKKLDDRHGFSFQLWLTPVHTLRHGTLDSADSHPFRDIRLLAANQLGFVRQNFAGGNARWKFCVARRSHNN